MAQHGTAQHSRPEQSIALKNSTLTSALQAQVDLVFCRKLGLVLHEYTITI